MPNRLYRSLQALLLLGLFLFLMGKVINNQLTWYINLRFVLLTQAGIIFLAVLTQRLFSEVRRSRKIDPDGDHDHDHAPSSVNLWIMLVPLLIGLLIPAKPLDASAVSAKGLTTSSALISADSSSRLLETVSEQRNILDWVKLFYFEQDHSPFIGQKASVIGFVYHDAGLSEGQFIVSRFILSCCAADGYAVGVIVEPADGASFEQDTWVQVTGSMDMISYNGIASPLIRAERVEVVAQPEQPYLYP